MMKKNNGVSIGEIVRTTTPIIFKAAPISTAVELGCMIFTAGCLAYKTVATEKFIDASEQMVNGVGRFNSALIALLILSLVVIGSEFLIGAFNFIGDYLMLKVTGETKKIVHDKASKLEAINYENTQFLDYINKAQLGAENSVSVSVVLFLVFGVYVPYFIFMGIYLFSLKPILSIGIVFIFIPVALGQFVRVKVFSKLEDESASLRREYEYYERAIVDREFFKETRLLGGFSYFKKLYKESLRALNNKVWKYEKQAGLLELALKLLTLLGYMGILFMLINLLLNGEITVGAFSAVFASVGGMFSLMEEVICMHIGGITKEYGTILNFMNFMKLPEMQGKDIKIEGNLEINMKHVSFAYPNSKENSLNDISFNINKGETIAIVGENGAGKTTLVKLLMGIYRPTEGNININGYDMSEINPKSIYDNVSLVSQKYQRYKMTLSDNVSISGKGDNIESIEEAIDKSDLDVNKDVFINGYNTMLSREFDGIDLSGGQWQRVAIARGFYKCHNMIVLDEPTAAIDPVEETKIYNKFKELSKDKTAVIVTHRLGSAKIADNIIVMDNGKVCEEGTHEELIKSKGKYWRMFEEQKKWY